jgi:nicotinate-nucleotide adenylyltransferase
MNLERIALFGGTFDPVHDGHMAIADAARDLAQIDRMFFIPCRISPHKTGSAPAASGADRRDMLSLVCQNRPWAHLDACELERVGPSYSWQTAYEFRDRFPGARLYWVMGEDQWRALPRWRHPEKLADMVEFLVCARGDRKPQARAGYRAMFFEADHPASATAIRTACSHGCGEEASRWLDPAVWRWICENRLYERK